MISSQAPDAPHVAAWKSEQLAAMKAEHQRQRSQHPDGSCVEALERDAQVPRFSSAGGVEHAPLDRGLPLRIFLEAS